MILSIWDTLNDIANKAENFIVQNYDNYFFWIILVAVLFAIAATAISKFSDK